MRTSIMSVLHMAFTSPIRRPRSSQHSVAAFHRMARDRISSDGQLRPAETPNSPQPNPPSNYVIGSPIPNTSPVPDAPSATPAQLDELSEFIEKAGSSGVLVITGAGCSTESNVPDYRSPGGAYSTGFKPMTHQAFMASSENRSRYWARSFAGWERFSTVQPNDAHKAIADLQNSGIVSDLLTQNVDRLHHKAGSNPVLEMHGTTHEVICMNCSGITPREEVQMWLARMNPEAAEAAAVLARKNSKSGGGEDEDERPRLLRAGTALPVARDLREAGAGVLRPDGDVELAQMSHFNVPSCPNCGGILKPDVVFFGDSLPANRAQKAMELATNASRIVVVGSSLAVWSAFRLIKAAKEQGSSSGIPVAIVNVGPTRGDDLADLKLEVRAGEAMQGVKERLLG